MQCSDFLANYFLYAIASSMFVDHLDHKLCL